MSPASRRGPRFTVPSTLPADDGGGVLGELTGQTPPAPAAAPAPAARPARRAPDREPETERPAVRIEPLIPADLADRLKGAVASLQYADAGFSGISEAATNALEAYVTAAENQFNEGEPFPWQQGRNLRPGGKFKH